VTTEEREEREAPIDAAGGEPRPAEAGAPGGAADEAGAAKAGAAQAAGGTASGGLEELVAALDAEVAAAPGEAPAAPPAGGPEPAARPARLVVFSLAGARYAVPAANVVEVGSPTAVTPVPNVPPWIVGVANLRGEIVSVVDLAGYLGLDGKVEGAPGGGRLMVVRTAAEEEAWTGSLLVDHVTGMLSVSPGEIGPTAAPITDRVAPYLTGVYHRDEHVVSVLDLDRLLTAEEFRQFERT
jgi:purine-binding chemotaxis protein CheW